MNSLKVLYLDHFSHTNSNYHWKAAFERVAQVQSLEIYESTLQNIYQLACQFLPDHIHLGGSVKFDRAPVELMANIRRQTGCSVSRFYGDPAPNEYILRLSQVASIYISNQTYVNIWSTFFH